MAAARMGAVAVRPPSRKTLAWSRAPAARPATTPDVDVDRRDGVENVSHARSANRRQMVWGFELRRERTSVAGRGDRNETRGGFAPTCGRGERTHGTVPRSSTKRERARWSAAKVMKISPR
jgi:hypothetical protein